MKNDLLNKYDIFIFDCDGVIFDVNLLKVSAFGQVVSEYPEQIVNEFVEYCKNSFGISRYIKFRDFFHKFSKEEFVNAKYDQFLIRYGDICKKIYSEKSLTPGSKELLIDLSRLDKKLFVVSGSDQNELNDVFLNNNLNVFFNYIYGSPKTKVECTEEIIRQYPNKKIAFIGDAVADMKTAKTFNLDFIYMTGFTVQSKELDEQCKKEAKIIINTLEDLISQE